MLPQEGRCAAGLDRFCTIPRKWTSREVIRNAGSNGRFRCFAQASSGCVGPSKVVTWGRVRHWDAPSGRKRERYAGYGSAFRVQQHSPMVEFFVLVNSPSHSISLVLLWHLVGRGGGYLIPLPCRGLQ